MIEKMFPKTVENILDYDVIKEAAKTYIEDIFSKIVKSFGDNLVLQTMDEEHLAEVSKNISGSTNMSIEEILDYINTDNIYRECEFVSDLNSAFPVGVTYEEFDVTGWGFPKSDIFPFNENVREGDDDEEDGEWSANVESGEYYKNLILARYYYRHSDGYKKKTSNRSSWGNSDTWMTTGGFGKPGTIHINVDEERTLIESNGLSPVENWLGTLSYKIPINLYIEINDEFHVRDSEDETFCLAGSTDGYKSSYPYMEEESICTNDKSKVEKYFAYERYPDGESVTFFVRYNHKTGVLETILKDGSGNTISNELLIDRKLLSEISGLDIDELDENFCEYLAEDNNVVVKHIANQIIDAEVIENDELCEIPYNGNLYDCQTDSLTPCLYDDENETVEVL